MTARRDLIGHDELALDRFELLRTLFEKELFDYLGLRLGAGGLESARAYCFATAAD